MISLQGMLPASSRRYELMFAACLELLLWLGAAAALPGKASAGLFLVVACWAAVSSPLRGLQLLTVQILLLHFNPRVVGFGSPAGLHLLAAAILLVKCLWQRRLRRVVVGDRVILSLLWAGPCFVAYELGTSTFPALSALKAALFFIHAVVVLTLSKFAFAKHRVETVQWYLGAITFLVVTSLLLLPTPYGRSFDGSSLNGILLHPNALGMFLGMGVAYLGAHAWSGHRLRWVLVGLALVGLVEIYLTASRGGLLVCLGSLATYFAVQGASGGRAFGRMAERAVLVAAVALPVVLALSGSLYEAATGFITKGRTEEASVGAAFASSRQEAVDLHLAMFKEKPWTGHGFQVVNAWTSQGFAVANKFNASGLVDESMIAYDPVTGKIPVSAPVESGFMYTSILAENGIFGSLVAYGVMLGVAIPTLLGRKRQEFVLLIGAFLANLSEATFFSPSGIGGWTWLMLGLAYASATAREPALNRAKGHSRRDALAERRNDRRSRRRVRIERASAADSLSCP